MSIYSVNILSVGNDTKGFATYGCCHPCFENFLDSVYLTYDSKQLRYSTTYSYSVTSNIYLLTVVDNRSVGHTLLLRSSFEMNECS